MGKDDVYESDIELSTKECVEVSLYMYEQWQEAMKPPIYAYYDFPTWLNNLKKGFMNTNGLDNK